MRLQAVFAVALILSPMAAAAVTPTVVRTHGPAARDRAPKAHIHVTQVRTR